MQVSKELQDFLVKYSSLLNNNEFEKLFQAAGNELGRFDELYSLLINADINILPYVKSIPNKYFEDSGIERIVIPSNVTGIGWAAFRDCKNLNYIIVPDSVIRIGEKAFQDCISLELISLPKIDYLKDYTFNRCVNLRDVQFSEGLKSIGMSAFSGCRNLESIHIPQSTGFIEMEAFYLCSKLKNVSLGSNIIEISSDAFYGCDSLKEIEYRGSINRWKDIDIDRINENIFQCTIHCIDGDFTY